MSPAAPSQYGGSTATSPTTTVSNLSAGTSAEPSEIRRYLTQRFQDEALELRAYHDGIYGAAYAKMGMIRVVEGVLGDCRINWTGNGNNILPGEPEPGLVVRHDNVIVWAGATPGTYGNLRTTYLRGQRLLTQLRSERRESGVLDPEKARLVVQLELLLELPRRAAKRDVTHEQWQAIDDTESQTVYTLSLATFQRLIARALA